MNLLPQSAGPRLLPFDGLRRNRLKLFTTTQQIRHQSHTTQKQKRKELNQKGTNLGLNWGERETFRASAVEGPEEEEALTRNPSDPRFLAVVEQRRGVSGRSRGRRAAAAADPRAAAVPGGGRVGKGTEKEGRNPRDEVAIDE